MSLCLKAVDTRRQAVIDFLSEVSCFTRDFRCVSTRDDSTQDRTLCFSMVLWLAILWPIPRHPLAPTPIALPCNF